MRCLKNLSFVGAFLSYGVIVVDDGSSDGTADEVRSHFPEVLIVEGDGQLWWAGATELGMREAISQSNCKGVIWLNDDCLPEEGTLEKLTKFVDDYPDSVVGGVTFTGLYGVYSGFSKVAWGLRKVRLPTEEEFLECDSLNGNCVVFSKMLIDALGCDLRQKQLPQYFGDSYYTLRAKEEGFRVCVSGSAKCQGIDERDEKRKSWIQSSIPMGELWDDRRKKGSALYWPARAYFFPRFWGLNGWLIAIAPYVRMFLIASVRLMPLSLRKFLFKGRQ